MQSHVNGGMSKVASGSVSQSLASPKLARFGGPVTTFDFPTFDL
jgi:hypothetical protein